LFSLIVSGCDDLMLMNNQSTYRYFVFDGRLLSELDGSPHKVLACERKKFIVAISSQELLP
jgi:hypothetical protein